MTDDYLPVSYDYREGIETEIKKQTSGKVFFFSNERTLDCVEGMIVNMNEVSGKGWFIELRPGATIRLDRVVTFFGKPGPAYEEYDRLGNVCLDCTGGYELD